MDWGKLSSDQLDWYLVSEQALNTSPFILHHIATYCVQAKDALQTDFIFSHVRGIFSNVISSIYHIFGSARMEGCFSITSSAYRICEGCGKELTNCPPPLENVGNCKTSWIVLPVAGRDLAPLCTNHTPMVLGVQYEVSSREASCPVPVIRDILRIDSYTVVDWEPVT